MNFAFASYSCISPRGVVMLDDHRPPDPNKPDRRAAAEMRAFDDLSPEARAAIANGPFGVQVAELLADVTRRGATTQVRERLQARGLLPCDVGTEGVALERVKLLEEAERERIKAELV